MLFDTKMNKKCARKIFFFLSKRSFWYNGFKILNAARKTFFRSMAPLYPPGLDENGAVANLYPGYVVRTSQGRVKSASLLCTIFVPGTKIQCCLVQFFSLSDRCRVEFFPRSEMPDTIFFLGSKNFKE